MIKKKSFVFLLVVIALGFLLLNRHDIKFWFESLDRERQAPPSVSVDELKSDDVEETDQAEEVIEDNKEEVVKTLPTPTPEEFNLKIPFSTQAPYANWDDPWQEACEEASVLMAHWFVENVESKTKDQANEEILELVDWQMAEFGYYKDTNAKETLLILQKRFGLNKSYLINDPTIDQIKKLVSDGFPVIVPAAGRKLGNPNFRGLGPLYHMLVIRGYDRDEFITNDPGTRHGENYRYKYDTIMNSMHDWNNGDVDNGEKIIIVVKYD